MFLAGETGEAEKSLPCCHFVDHKSDRDGVGSIEQKYGNMAM
jgi:hypothetical protein